MLCFAPALITQLHAHSTLGLEIHKEVVVELSLSVDCTFFAVPSSRHTALYLTAENSSLELFCCFEVHNGVTCRQGVANKTKWLHCDAE